MTNQGPKVHFVADIHGDHRNIIKYSGRTMFMSPDELDDYNRLKLAGDLRMKSLRVSDESVGRMHDHIFTTINKYVGERDELWCLGDFFLKHDLQRLYDLRYRIKCKTIHYVWGNHDDWWRGQQTPYLFNSYHDALKVVINCQKIFMSHYAHVVWPKSHRGTWHLFGHSHGSLNPWINKHMPNSRMLDVGIDNAFTMFGEYRPFTFDEVRLYMANKTGESVDHHEPSGPERDDDNFME